ncbi:MAG: hypothetical protein U5J96_11185 [Ignavibacteriaceae bacterium]|nr:hypothetical protein [Ignavibacteriaceae bacterium]
MTFFSFKEKPFALGYSVKYDDEEFVVLFNADPKSSLVVDIPDGEWNVLADENTASVNPLKTLKKKVTLNSSTGMILKKK